MKYRIIMLGIAFLSYICLSAIDYNMVILKNDGSKVIVSTEDIEKVYFEETTESDKDILLNIVVGVWAQDGDNDIFIVNADGTGIVYGSPELYEQKKDGGAFTWSYKNGWIYAGVKGVQEEEMRVEYLSENKIVWRRYAIPSDYDDPSEDEWDGHDAFGYYEFWTWERYNK